MGLSSIAAKQREKEVEALKSLLSCSLIGSLALHIGVLAFGIGNLLNKVPEITDEPDEPIEVAIIDSPNIKDVEPKEATEGGSASAGGGGEPRSNASTASSQSPAKEAIAFSPAPIVAVKPISPSVKKFAQNPATPRQQQKLVQAPKPIDPSPTVTKPVTTPSPVATQPKPVVTPSPIPSPSAQPASTPQNSVAVNQPPQKVTPSIASPLLQNQEQGTEQLRNLLAGVRNSRDQQTAASGSSSQPNFAGASGNSIGSRFGTGSGSGTQTGIVTGTGLGSGTGSSGRGTGTGTGTGTATDSSGRGTGTGSSGRGTGTATGTGSERGSRIATGSRRIRRAAPAAGSGNRDAGSGDDGVGCRSNCKPLYPTSARRRGEEGQPQVRVDIGSDGKATNVRLARSSGNRELDEAALRGVRRAKYKAPSGGRQGVLVKVDFAIEGSQRHRQLRERQKRKETARRNRRTNTAVTRQPATQTTAERSNPTRRIRRNTSATQPSAVRSRNAATVSPRRSTPTAAPRRRQRIQTAAPRRLRQATPRSQTNLRQSLRRPRPTSQPAAPRSQSKLRNSLRTYQQRSQSAPQPAAPNNSQ